MLHVDRIDPRGSDQGKQTWDIPYAGPNGELLIGIPPAEILHRIVRGAFPFDTPREALRKWRRLPLYEAHREKLDPLLETYGESFPD